jgi:hypothetical protein
MMIYSIEVLAHRKSHILRVEAVCQPRKLVMGYTKGMPIAKETKEGGPYRLVKYLG